MRRSALAVLTLAALWPLDARAQEWSRPQLEVWQNVETYWELYANNDLEGFLEYFHDDFSGWADGDPIPFDKADRASGYERFIETSEVVWYRIKPAAIKIHDDVAIVHYFFWMTIADADGEVSSAQGHWTDILTRRGDRWVMIADAGVTTEP